MTASASGHRDVTPCPTCGRWPLPTDDRCIGCGHPRVASVVRSDGGWRSDVPNADEASGIAQQRDTTNLLLRALLAVGALTILVSYLLPWLEIEVLVLRREIAGTSVVSSLYDALSALLRYEPRPAEREEWFWGLLRLTVVLAAAVAPGLSAIRCLVVAARLRRRLRPLLVVEALSSPTLWLGIGIVVYARVDAARQTAGPLRGFVDVGVELASNVVGYGLYVTLGGMVWMALAAFLAAGRALRSTESDARPVEPVSGPLDGTALGVTVPDPGLAPGYAERTRSALLAPGVLLAGAACTTVVIVGFVLAAAYAVVGLARPESQPLAGARASSRSPVVVPRGSVAERSTPATVRLWPVRATASSQLRRGYRAALMFDGDLRTCWADGVPGLGVGEWVEAELGALRTLRRVVVVPGYDKWHPRSGDLFLKNAQLRRFRLESDAGWAETFSAPRGVRRVSYELPDVPARRLRLVVLEAWPGTRWEDLSISEVELYGR